MTAPLQTLVVGIGSRFGDDRLGPLVAAELTKHIPRCEIRVLRSPAELLGALAGVARLHVVDACRGAGPPGTIVRFTWPASRISALEFSGTHDLGLAAALQLSDTLGELPSDVTLWGVEAGDDSRQITAESLSPPVAAAATTLVAQLRVALCDATDASEAGCHA